MDFVLSSSVEIDAVDAGGCIYSVRCKANDKLYNWVDQFIRINGKLTRRFIATSYWQSTTAPPNICYLNKIILLK